VVPTGLTKSTPFPQHPRYYLLVVKEKSYMTNTQTDASPQSQAVTKIRELFGQCQDGERTAGYTMAVARKIERQVAKLVAKVAALAPGSDEHAEALSFHEYTLLSLARTSKRKAVSQALRTAAYARGAASVAMQLQSEKQDVGTVFAAYNLAIDLIIVEKRSQEGLDWMLKSRALLTKLAGKKKLPKSLLYFKLFGIDYGIAQAYYDLGQKAESRRILKRALSQAPALNTADWSDQRGVAKCCEVLAQIRLDELDAERASKQAK